MPIFKMYTNVPKSNFTLDFLNFTTDKIAQTLGKSKSAVAVIVNSDTTMIRGGSDAPFAFCDLLTIGQNTLEQNKNYTAELTDFFESHLQIPRNRLTIWFNTVDMNSVGWNGTAPPSNFIPVPGATAPPSAGVAMPRPQALQAETSFNNTSITISYGQLAMGLGVTFGIIALVILAFVVWTKKSSGGGRKRHDMHMSKSSNNTCEDFYEFPDFPNDSIEDAHHKHSPAAPSETAQKRSEHSVRQSVVDTKKTPKNWKGKTVSVQ